MNLYTTQNKTGQWCVNDRDRNGALVATCSSKGAAERHITHMQSVGKGGQHETE